MLAAAARRALLLDAADAQSLALAQRVEGQADVLAQLAAALVLDRAGLVGEVAVQELAEGPLADEADAGRVLLLRIGQPDLLGQPAHLGLGQLADREHRLAQLRLVEPVQEVALVLERVQALEQLHLAVLLAHPRVMAGGDLLGAQSHRVVQEGLELDLGVAQHVRVGRAAGLVLAQELGEDAVLVLGGEVDVLDLDADHVGHRRRVDEVDVGGAVLAVVVVFPVLHEDADDFMARLLEQPGGHGGINAAGQPDDDALLLGIHGARLSQRSARPVPRGAGRRPTRLVAPSPTPSTPDFVTTFTTHAARGEACQEWLTRAARFDAQRGRWSPTPPARDVRRN